ncbi:hypothetical protein [Alicyclobacillus sendaiensis]|uniref:Uncharacterized protein n=1 Tax=Alicyclobacillus sendaiensis PA2 TaxID=3029425 RepID=A0ABT6Y171_ALISE|nr:hypothetical protein [Alicyclobacillus sendaiensis]MDI9261065.1 hypothetical protein [Alicyclobacillus sendaiensis PA2]
MKRPIFANLDRDTKKGIYLLALAAFNVGVMFGAAYLQFSLFWIDVSCLSSIIFSFFVLHHYGFLSTPSSTTKGVSDTRQDDERESSGHQKHDYDHTHLHK